MVSWVLSFVEKTPCNVSLPFNIVHIGRLDYKDKGQDLLINAASISKGQVYVTGGGRPKT